MSISENTGTTGVKLVVGAYIATMGVIILSIMLVMLFMVDTHRCSAMERALATLWTIIGIVIIISTILVGAAAYKLIANRIGCFASVAAFVVAILGCSVLLSFGMMVTFNC